MDSEKRNSNQQLVVIERALDGEIIPPGQVSTEVRKPRDTRLNRLSAAFVASIEQKRLLGKNGKVGWFHDGGGLWVRSVLRKDGTVSASYAYRFNFLKKQRVMPLGRVTKVLLKDARIAAEKCRVQVRDGTDPVAALLARKQASALAATVAEDKGKTVRDMLDEMLNAIEGEVTEKHWNAYKHSIVVHAAPLLDVAMADLNTNTVLALLRPLFKTSRVKAMRCRARLAALWGLARAHKFVDEANPLAWENHLQLLLEPGRRGRKGKIKRKPKHLNAVEWYELPPVMEQIRAIEGPIARCCEAVVLSVARLSETVNLRWDDIKDIAVGHTGEKIRCLVVPAERMKAGVEHWVPLNGRLLTIFEEQKARRVAGNLYIFAGLSDGKPVSPASVRRAFKSVCAATLHGSTRSGFKGLCDDLISRAREGETGYVRGYTELLSEHCLAHKLGDETMSAYKRSEALPARRDLLLMWQQLCGGLLEFGPTPTPTR